MTASTQVKDLHTMTSEEVKRIIYKVMGFPKGKVIDFRLTPSEAFGPSYEDCVEIVMLCEDSFDLNIDDNAFNAYLTNKSQKPVNDFISLIMCKCLEKDLNGPDASKKHGTNTYIIESFRSTKGEPVTEKQVPVEIMYEQSVWLNAVKDAESAVMRNLPVLSGGRNSGEDLLEYRDRCLANLDAAVKRFVYAEKKYKEANARVANPDGVDLREWGFPDTLPVPPARKRKSKKQ